MRILATVIFLCMPFMLGCSSASITSIDQAHSVGLLDDFDYIQVEYQKQAVPTLCGLACLTSVLTTWDVEADQLSIFKTHPPKNPSKGYSLGELKVIAEQNGLKGFCLEGDMELLERQLKNGRPVMVALRRASAGEAMEDKGVENIETPSHAVVVCGKNNKSFLVMDPAHGFHTLEITEFDELWLPTGRACLLVSR